MKASFYLACVALATGTISSMTLADVSHASSRSRSAETSRAHYVTEVDGLKVLASGSAEHGFAGGDRKSGAYALTLGAYSRDASVVFTRTDGAALEPGTYRIVDPVDGITGPGEVMALVVSGPAERPTAVLRGHSGTLTVASRTNREMTGSFSVKATGFLATDTAKDDLPASASGTFVARSR
jgi:hypothetical protein